MIYLLHFEPPIGKASHYLGVCREDRLTQRLREHALGNGARLIAYAIKHGRKVWLARTFPGGNHALETTMKRHGNFRLMCPLCCPLLERLKAAAFEIDASRPEQPPARAVLDWRPQEPPTKTPK